MAGAAELMIGEPIRPRRKGCAGFCAAPAVSIAARAAPLITPPCPSPGLVHYLLYFRQSPIMHRCPSFSRLSPHLAATRLVLGIHLGPLGDVGAEHRQQCS